MSIINSAYSFLLKKGFLKDPVSTCFADRYQNSRDLDYAKTEVDRIELVAGPVRGRKVIDVGGGPGLVSIEMARRGADVTWYDVSKNYETLASSNMKEAGIVIKRVRGLIDEDFNKRLEKFDLVVCLVCWYYSDSDRKMASFLRSIVTDGGGLYVSCNVRRHSKGKIGRLRSFFYHKFGVKIGHPFPLEGMILQSTQAVGFTTVYHWVPKDFDHDDVERMFCVLGV